MPTNECYFKEMSAFHRRVLALLRVAIVALLTLCGLVVIESPAGAFDLFTTHEVTAQFATADGKQMADAEVRVFAPGEQQTPVETGRTDADGRFVFSADRDGLWTVEARTKTEVARVTIRVGGQAQRPQQSRVPPIVVISGLLGLLAVALWYRVLRRRNQRRP